MAADSFERALALVLTFEGGFVHHPADPGGATNRGITRATLARARGRPASVADVKALSAGEAAAIYRRLYWAAIRGDDLPPGIDIVVFDTAVNSGPGQSARFLQRVLGLRQDGAIGPQTLAAAAGAERRRVIEAYTRERLAFLRALASWPIFGRGWARRVAAIERAALAAAASTSPVSQPSKGADMIDTKTIFASRTVWANLIGLASIGLGLAGVRTGTIDANGLADAAAQLVAAGSFIVSTVFRIAATRQIGTA